MGEFILNREALDDLAKSPEMLAALSERAEELADEIRGLIPDLSEPERAGWSAAEPGEIAESIKVGVDDDGNVMVYSDNFRIRFIEFGTLRLDGSQTPIFAPFRRAIEGFAAANGLRFEVGETE